MTHLKRFIREEEGQDLIEYALLCALIAVAAIAGMNGVATEINGLFGRVGATLAAGANP
jgi:pilus assembly protein Flp/PilA